MSMSAIASPPTHSSYYTVERGPVSVSRRTQDVVVTGSPQYFERRVSRRPSVISAHSVASRYSTRLPPAQNRVVSVYGGAVSSVSVPRLLPTSTSPLVHYRSAYFPDTFRSSRPYRSFYSANPYLYAPPSVDSSKRKSKKRSATPTCGAFFDFFECGSFKRGSSKPTH
eukprot:Gregarina_sp_Pseudo_9__3430@NODE_35_length_5456_cov_132_485693_g32_i0_p5_GENE_NODE_35_length_5456_cov_132_485693_g32_i0NODE_35_length_5456_cov_132_485693_g32_i0_p5_ORF_typecomplete_len168_score31_77_NODE_35_length_5456_cov_132_485693_g32_i0258761